MGSEALENELLAGQSPAMDAQSDAMPNLRFH